MDAPGSPFWDDETDCDESLLSMRSGVGNDSIDMSALDRSDVSRESSGDSDGVGNAATTGAASGDVSLFLSGVHSTTSTVDGANNVTPSRHDTSTEHNPDTSPYAEEASYPPRRRSATGPKMTPTGGAMGWI